MGERDALGHVSVVKHYKSFEPPSHTEAIFRVPREENVHLNRHTVVLDTAGQKVQGKSEMKITSQPAPSPLDTVPRPKRVLPTLPVSPTSYRQPFGSTKENLGFNTEGSLPMSTTRDAFSPERLAEAEPSDRPCMQPLPPAVQCRFCTATGPGTALLCMHCDNVYCMACLNSRAGSMFAYDAEQYPILRCAKCNRNPRSCPIAERPPWQGTTSIAGAPLLPVVGCDRRQEEKLLRKEDKVFLSLLRTDTQVATADISPPRSTGSPEGLPSVFQRLTNHRLFSGSHKHRFSSDGVGLGLEGRRDDTVTQRVIAGQGMITRDIEPEIDCPHKPALSFDARPSSSASTHRPSDDAVPEVYQRLAKATNSKPSGEYESMLKVRRDFEARSWRAGD